MKIRSFSQRYGYITVSLVVAFVCAIPMLVAQTDDDDYVNTNPAWEAWA